MMPDISFMWGHYCYRQQIQVKLYLTTSMMMLQHHRCSPNIYYTRCLCRPDCRQT